MKEIKITQKEENQRLDKFLFKYFNKAPKSFVYKMLRKNELSLTVPKHRETRLYQTVICSACTLRRTQWIRLWRKRLSIRQKDISA